MNTKNVCKKDMSAVCPYSCYYYGTLLGSRDQNVPMSRLDNKQNAGDIYKCHDNQELSIKAWSLISYGIAYPVPLRVDF